MKYLDADRLKAEIERLHKAHSGKYGCDEVGSNLEYLEDFIDSLQQEKLLAVVPGFLERDFHEEIRFSTENDKFYGDTSFILPEDSVSYEDLIYETIKVELLIRKV